MKIQNSISSNNNISKSYKNVGQQLKPLNIKQLKGQRLRFTLGAFERNERKYLNLAVSNIRRWKNEASKIPNNDLAPTIIRVTNQDSLEAALQITREHGELVAVLNMANGTFPGGGYQCEYNSQEESLFRNTNLHFTLDRGSILEQNTGERSQHGYVWKYTNDMMQLINGKNGSVYLSEQPVLCIRSCESESWLAANEVFSFWEMRSAALKRRKNDSYNEEEMRNRITAQLRTLKNRGCRYLVLGAFGCGAFGNPARDVSQAYRDILNEKDFLNFFNVVVFAVLHSCNSKDGMNYYEFQKTFLETRV